MADVGAPVGQAAVVRRPCSQGNIREVPVFLACAAAA